MSTPNALIEAIVEAKLADVFTALPGVVTKYDPNTNTVDVRPTVRHGVPDPENGIGTYEDLPVVQSVPVQFPSVAGGGITFPIVIGTPVLLVFCAEDLSGWWASGEVSDPVVPIQHGLTGAVAIPGIRTKATPPPVSVGNTVIHATGEVHLGGPDPSDAVALASLAKAELEALVVAVKTHVHVCAAPSSPSGPPVDATLVPWDHNVSDVKSDKVKAE